MDWGKVLYPVLSALLTAFLFWVLGWIGRVPEILIPTGAVVAFKMVACPSGWDDFRKGEGKVIVGAGKTKGLSMRTILETGGEEQHTLTVDELPAHSQSYLAPKPVKEGGEGGPQEATRTYYESSTGGSTGQGKPHNNMPPFVVLRYCEKIE